MKKIELTILLLASLIISSCSSNYGDGRENVKLQKGTDGLTMRFMKNTPKEMFEEGNAYLTFEIMNEGFYDIKNGVVFPSFEKDFMEFDSWDLPKDFRADQKNVVSFDLNGKTLSNTRGEKQVVMLKMKAKRIDDTRNKIKSRIVLNACYHYASILSETICIDTDPNELSIAKKTCKVMDITSSGQGGPVAITKIEEKVLPASSKDKVIVQFTIYAENKGEGNIIDYNRYKEICEGESNENEDYNTVYLKSLKFSYYSYEDGDIECIPLPLKETKEGYYTRCTLKEENAISKDKFTFETPLVIEINYGYKMAIAEDMEILNKEQSDE